MGQSSAFTEFVVDFKYLVISKRERLKGERVEKLGLHFALSSCKK